MEGAIIFASLVVGVAITDQLSSLHRLLRRRREVRWDPLCLALAALITMTILMVWWTLAGNADEQSVTIGAFLPWLVILMLQYLMASASLPDRGEETDLFAYYAAQSRYIWTLVLLAALVMNAVASVQLAMSGAGVGTIIGGRWMEYVVLALMASAVIIRKRWWHWIVLAVLSIGPIGWLSLELG